MRAVPHLHQATAVAIHDRALLLEGPPGIGKSSLALALIDRGAMLVGDDGVALFVRDGALWAGPPSATEGMIELEGIGIVRLPATSSPVALILRLGETGPRYVERANYTELAGHPIPVLGFDAGGLAAPIRAEHALALHGLPRLHTV